MSAKITLEPLAWCDDCAEGDNSDPETWAEEHNSEYHTPETETP